MTASFNAKWFTKHHRWEEIFSAGLGILILLSPLFVAGRVDVGGAVIISAGLAGILIAMLALLEAVRLEPWQERLELACGAWVTVAPLILQYGGALRIWHFVLGGMVMAIALLKLWQEPNAHISD